MDIKEIDLVAGRIMSLRGWVSTRGGDSLEGLLEKNFREDGGEILQVDRLAFSNHLQRRNSRSGREPHMAT
jgi:hypothetical protein